MTSMRDNAQRVKRLRELKATLRTNRERLLVGIDIAQAAHVVLVRQAHARVVTPARTVPNTTRGFTQLWTAITRAQRTTGCREGGCGLEPTGTSHQALATFLETQGADVLLLSSSGADWNRRTQDGTWDKHDRKDAANCADLLAQGKGRFYSQPTGPLADLRRLVKVLRRARAELARCKARWRTTLRPPLAPMGEPFPNRLRVELPAVLQAKRREDRFGGFKALADLPGRGRRPTLTSWGGLAQRAAVRSGAGGRRAPATALNDGRTAQRLPRGVGSARIATWRLARNRDGTPVRRSRSQQPGLGRVRRSGSEQAEWPHYDGA